MENSRTNQTEETKVEFPSDELKAWYAGLSIESKLAAAMMMYLTVDGIGNTPDHGATGVEILHKLDSDILKANDLSENLIKFREVYEEVKKGN